jgi:uncharacterized protein YukE
MGQIRVTPAALRRIADSIDRSARVVEDRVFATGQIIGPLIQNGVFRGNLASNLMTGYEQTRPTMERWPHDMRNFSAMLRLAAEKFEEADQQHAATLGGALALEGTGSAPGGSRDADLLLSGACTDTVDLGPGMSFVSTGGAYGQGQVVVTDPAMIQQIASQYGLNIGPVRELRIDVYVPNGGMWPLSNMVGYDGPSIGAILPQPGNLYGDYTVQPYTFQPTGPQLPGTQPLTFYTRTPVEWTGGQWADSSLTFIPVRLFRAGLLRPGQEHAGLRHQPDRDEPGQHRKLFLCTSADHTRPESRPVPVRLLEPAGRDAQLPRRDQLRSRGME